MTVEQGGQHMGQEVDGDGGGAGVASEMGAGVPLAGHVPGLSGIRGRLRLDVGDRTVGVLVIDDGQARLEGPGGSSDALVSLSSIDDVRQILRGEANPVVLALLGREQIQGNLLFAIKVLLGLREGSPFKNAPGAGQQQGG